MPKANRSSTKSVSVTLKFRKDEVRLSETTEYTSVGIRRGVPLGKPGEPALPWIRQFIYIPPGATATKLEVENHSTIVIGGKVVLEPCQESEPTIIGNLITWTGPDEKLYSSRTPWPKTFAVLSKTRRYGGFQIAEVLLCPFRYVPFRKKLELVNKIELKLTYKVSERRITKTDSVQLINHHRKFAQRVRDLVVNDFDVEQFMHLDISDPSPMPCLLPTVDCVIITDTLLSTAFQRLAQWRTWMGIRTRVVTLSDIVAGSVPDTNGHSFWESTGYNDGGTRDESEAIRNFIKWVTVNWGTDYVLLGGDNEVIPVRHCLHSKVGSVKHGDLNVPYMKRELANAAVASSEITGSPASSVIDEDSASEWQCAAGDANPWITLGMIGNTPVNKVVLEWGNNFTAVYDIEVSHDGSNWINVYSCTTGTGGTEEVLFDCVSAGHVRISFPGAAGFSMTGIQLYGASRTKRSGVSYVMDVNTTRIYIGWKISMQPNETNSVDGNQIVIKNGPIAGTVIPYNPAASATSPGWRFVQDLMEMPGTISASSTRFVEICGPAEIHNNQFVLKRNYNYIPADLYYSDIEASEYPGASTHDFDADDNLIYGERFGGELDEVNGIADIFIGRSPVETVDEVNNFIDKVIRYERYQDQSSFLYPTDFAISVLLGSKDWKDENVVGVLDRSAKGKESIRAALLSYDADRWKFTRLYEDHTDVPVDDQGVDLDEASKDKILDAISSGNHIVSLSSHGNSDCLCYLDGNDVGNVENIPSIFYGNACSTNKFDGTGVSEALSERTILNTIGGAVAYVGNTRFGWTGDNPMELEFWEQHLTSERLGDMFNGCKLVILGWQSYSMNLLGDPVMRVWSDRPRQITVDHAAEIVTGSQQFVVTVKADGEPVANAAVTVVMDGTLFASTRTDDSGIVQLSIAPSLDGTMRVTVCGKNLIPYLGSVTVNKVVSDCNNVVTCLNKISCGPSITCKPLIGCTKQISCGLKIACRADILCGTQINCSSAIYCRSTINCVQLITCGSNITCGSAISCNLSIACPNVGDMCPTINPRPDDFLKDFLKERWGVEDLMELAGVIDPSEIEMVIERLPDNMKKPLQKMFRKFERSNSR